MSHSMPWGAMAASLTNMPRGAQRPRRRVAPAPPRLAPPPRLEVRRMAVAANDRDQLPDTGRAFATTHWSVVLAAKQSDSVRADAALEKLCRSYWPPLYAYLRREGYGVQD